MGRIKGKGYLLLGGLILFIACETRKLDYPDVIQEYGLEALYDQAIIDWHILNSTGAFSESRYLFREDSLIPSPEWIPSVDSMQKYYPGRIFDFLEVELALFPPEPYSRLTGDTIVFSFSPEIIENDYLIDPVDGYYSALHYVDGKLIQENRGRFLIEMPDSVVRPYEADLIELVKSKPKRAVHPQLRRRISSIDEHKD